MPEADLWNGREGASGWPGLCSFSVFSAFVFPCVFAVVFGCVQVAVLLPVTLCALRTCSTAFLRRAGLPADVPDVLSVTRRAGFAGRVLTGHALTSSAVLADCMRRVIRSSWAVRDGWPRFGGASDGWMRSLMRSLMRSCCMRSLMRSCCMRSLMRSCWARSFMDSFTRKGGGSVRSLMRERSVMLQKCARCPNKHRFSNGIINHGNLPLEVAIGHFLMESHILYIGEVGA